MHRSALLKGKAERDPAAPALLGRRALLQGGALGLGAVALSELLAADAIAAGEPAGFQPPHFRPKARRVLFLFMAGAPSQLDLFDPKPRLRELHGQPVPASILAGLDDALIKGSARLFASPRSFSRHGRCGMEFSDFLPHLATCADDLCMVRSLHTTASNHDPAQLLMNCGTPLFGSPSMGSWVLYGIGNPSRDLPGFVVLLSNSGKGIDGGSALWHNGFLPSAYRGVTFRSRGEPILHLNRPAEVDAALQAERISAIGDLNRLRKAQVGDPEIDSRISAYELAFRMQAAAPELLDLSGETARTREAYGLEQEKTRWFGTNCLLARRMLERGVRFVQLYHSTWDDHSDLNRNLRLNTEMTDQPAAALIRDLKQRGLLDDTLVIWGGEFGRTPMNEVRRGINPGKEGRDHHPFAFTMLLAGGGIGGGRVVGRTDELGYHAVEDPIHVHDLQATLLHCLGLDHTRLTFRHQGRDFRLTDVSGRVVEKLL
jgi:hypothetical protein